MSIVLVGLVATAYTLMGGLAAVVWTDLLQLVVVIVGVVLCAVIAVGGIPGGLRAALEIAREHGRLQLVDLSLPSSSVRSVAGAVLGYGILSLSVAGTNQQPVQRYLACKSTADARRAALTGWAVGLFVTLITLLLGVLFFAFYQVHAHELSPDLAPDAIFPRFAADHLPAGILGLAVAAIFAAAMSSLDSALHSLSTSSVVDLYRRFFSSNRSDMHYLKVARGATLSWGLLGIAAALYVAGRGSLLAMAVRYVGYFAGPVLGLFLLGLLIRRSNETGAVSGVCLAFLAVVLSVNAETLFGRPSPVHGIWIAALGCAVTLAAGTLLSLLAPAPAPRQLQGLVRGEAARTP